MKEHPILFSGPMVRAILEGRKTQTRRVLTCPRNPRGRRLPYEPWEVEEDGKLLAQDGYGDFHPIEETQQPYGQPGDRLWVRETHWIDPHTKVVFYRADGDLPKGIYADAKWRPSIHMPRWASRITLEVTEIRVERVQDISTEDILAEGVATTLREHDAEVDLQQQFHALWDSLNAGRGYGWNPNPWVWAVTFKVIP